MPHPNPLLRILYIPCHAPVLFSPFNLHNQQNGRVYTYGFAAVQVHQVDGAAFAFQQVLRLSHYLRHQALQVVLLLEDAASQVEQDL